jgi:hypothetical protein
MLFHHSWDSLPLRNTEASESWQVIGVCLAGEPCTGFFISINFIQGYCSLSPALMHLMVAQCNTTSPFVSIYCYKTIAFLICKPDFLSGYLQHCFSKIP